MLQKIRDGRRGILGTLVLGAIVVVMAFFGIGSFLAPDVNPPVASVDGNEISQIEYRNQYQRYLAGERQRLGDRFDPQLFDSPLFRRQFLDSLVDQRLLLDTLASSGLTIADSQLRETIQGAPGFQTDGQFNPETYRIFLASSGQTTTQFEDGLREDLLLQELPRVIGASSVSTDAEQQRVYALQNQQRSYDFLLLDAAARQQQIEIPSDQVQQFYDDNALNFLDDEKVIVEFVELKAGELESTIAIDEGDLRARYELEKEQLKSKERRLTSHILLEVDQDAEDATVEQALQQAQALIEQLGEGADFAALAMEYSADPGSADLGGDLDWVEQGVMVSEFEDALFALEVGEISPPVRTEYGFHIIQLRDLQAEALQNFDQVRDELELKLRQEKAQDRFAELEANLSQLAFEQSSSLQSVADELGIDLARSTPFSANAGEQGIAAYPVVRQAAFSDEVLQERRNSDSILVEPGHAVFLRIAEYIEATQKPLDDVAPQIEEQLKRELAAEQIDQQATELLGRAQAGEPFNQLAETSEIELQVIDAAARFGASAPFVINRAVFSLPAPADDTGYLAIVDAGNGSKAVVKLRDVSVSDDAVADQSLAERIRRSQASAEISALVAQLRTQADITIDESEFSGN